MKPHQCPEDDGYRCPVCERAIGGVEADMYAPTGYDDMAADYEAGRAEDMFERGWGG